MLIRIYSFHDSVKMLQNNSLEVTATLGYEQILHRHNIPKRKTKRTTTYLSRVPKEKSSSLASARANLIFDEYCKIGIYNEKDRSKILRIHNEYEENPNSSSYLLFDLKYGFIDGRATVTYVIDKFQNLPSYVEGYWREEDIEYIIERKGHESKGLVAEIGKFATNPDEGKNSAVDVMRLYGSVFSEIKKNTDNIFISACGRDLKNYVGMGLGEAFEETKHNSDKLNGNEVVAGYIGLSNMESRIHKLLKKMAIKETPTEEIEDLEKAYVGYVLGNGNPLWNCI